MSHFWTKLSTSILFLISLPVAGRVVVALADKRADKLTSSLHEFTSLANSGCANKYFDSQEAEKLFWHSRRLQSSINKKLKLI